MTAQDIYERNLSGQVKEHHIFTQHVSSDPIKWYMCRYEKKSPREWVL